MGAGTPITEHCSGGGASHAGNGGLPTPTTPPEQNADASLKCMKIIERYGEYDSMNISEGSGGGSDSSAQGGAGGGYIYI